MRNHQITWCEKLLIIIIIIITIIIIIIIIMDSAVPTDHRVKIKENKKRDKYLDLARELKRLWNMKVNEIPIVTGTLRTIPKSW